VAKATALMQVGGVRGMANSLHKLGREGQRDNELDKEMKAASKMAAEAILPYAKRRVPVASGRLRDSIRADATRRYGRIIAGSPARVPYARIVHRGGVVPSGKKYRGTKYVSKAIPEAFPEIVDAYISAMNAVAKKFQKRYGVDRIMSARR